MAKGYSTRKLELFSIHVTQANHAQIDYGKLFSVIAGNRGAHHIDLGEKIVALSQIAVEGDAVSLAAYEGEAGVSPMFFDTETEAERIGKLGKREFLATKTHALIHIPSRQAIIEYNHRGAKADDLASVLEGIAPRADKAYAGIGVEFAPIADEEFLGAISRFERIRVASVRLAEPNASWSDDHHSMTKFAEDSGGHSILIEINAARARSLDKSKGILPFLRDLAIMAKSPLKAAKVIGTRPEESAETTVSLANHVEHQTVSVRLHESGHVVDADIKHKMDLYLKSRTQKGKKND